MSPLYDVPKIVLMLLFAMIDTMEDRVPNVDAHLQGSVSFSSKIFEQSRPTSAYRSPGFSPGIVDLGCSSFKTVSKSPVPN